MSIVDGCVLLVCSGANGRFRPLADWPDQMALRTVPWCGLLGLGEGGGPWPRPCDGPVGRDRIAAQRGTVRYGDDLWLDDEDHQAFCRRQSAGRVSMSGGWWSGDRADAASLDYLPFPCRNLRADRGSIENQS